MKKFYLFLIAFFFLTIHIQAQQDPGIDSTNNKVAQPDSSFVVVETLPEFPGGEAAMMRFIAKNIKYPALAIENNITGTVYVQFIIDENGDVKNATVIKGIGWGCDEEALRVINAMPKWTPGSQKGKNVKVTYLLPIRFHLEDRKERKKRKKGK